VDRGGRGALERFRKKRSEETIDPEELPTLFRLVQCLLLLRHPPVDRPCRSQCGNHQSPR
jgi:hypothetical protein